MVAVRAAFVLVAGLLLAQLAGAASPAVETLLLWPGGAPGAAASGGDETVRVTEQGEHVVSNVHRPTIAVYLPSKKLATGAAVVVVPGGGHRELWMDHEGYNIAKFLNTQGIAAFVLKYRLARAPNSTYSIDGDALNDLKRALRTVRARASGWSVDPHKVGVIGFSAGGQLAALGATRSDAGDANATDAIEKQGSRPDFVGLVYPGTWPDLKLADDTPPMFLLCGGDDRPEVVTAITHIYLSLRENKVPAELHLYDRVAHGFGLRASNKGPISAWPQQFVDWIGPTLAAR
ncbi:MAG: alpha/beta hydrolase [Pseudomonadota bacterium]